MTKTISVQLVPTMSLTGLVYIQLFRHVEAYKSNSRAQLPIVEAAKLAYIKMDKYYPSSDGLVYIVGQVLDPRCKLKWFKEVNFKPDVIKGYKQTVIDYWKKHYKPVGLANCDEDAEDIFERQLKRARPDNRDEMEIYLSEGIVKSSSLVNGMLGWWKDNQSKYPNLSRMARDFLGVSATGVPAESMFTMGTDLLDPKRMSMAGETVKMSLCLRAWLKFKSREEFLKEKASLVSKRMLGCLDSLD
ncbi:unnamed protein product, partial [Allacma fusca]